MQPLQALSLAVVFAQAIFYLSVNNHWTLKPVLFVIATGWFYLRHRRNPAIFDHLIFIIGSLSLLIISHGWINNDPLIVCRGELLWVVFILAVWLERMISLLPNHFLFLSPGGRVISLLLIVLYRQIKDPCGLADFLLRSFLSFVSLTTIVEYVHYLHLRR